MPIPWSFVLENVLSAVLIVAYLAYELRFGRGAELADEMEGMASVIIALAEENPEINEEDVIDRFNGERPEDYKIDGSD